MNTNDITQKLTSVRDASPQDTLEQDSAGTEIAGVQIAPGEAAYEFEDAPTLPLDKVAVEAAGAESAAVGAMGAAAFALAADGAASPADFAQGEDELQAAWNTLPQLHRRHFHLRRWHIVASVVLLVMIVVVSVAGTFFWNRWHRYNDAQDIQGTWYVLGSQVAINITPDQLVFNKNTAYNYLLDSETKTLSFTLGNMDGLAHYCFFEQRDVLMIVDGHNYTRWGTASSDFLLSLEQFALLSEGRIPNYPEGEGMIVLARTPDKYTWGDFSYKFVDEADATNDRDVSGASGASGAAGDAT